MPGYATHGTNTVPSLPLPTVVDPGQQRAARSRMPPRLIIGRRAGKKRPADKGDVPPAGKAWCRPINLSDSK